MLNRVLFLNLFVLFVYSASLLGQQTYSGYVFDSNTNQPLDRAEITIPGTDYTSYTNSQGFFYLNPDFIDSLINTKDQSTFSFFDHQLNWQSASRVSIGIYDIQGKNVGGSVLGNAYQGTCIFPNLKSGIYFLKLSTTRSYKTIKFQVIDNQISLNTNEIGLKESVQIMISRKTYTTQSFFLKQNVFNYYYLTKGVNNYNDYLYSIPDITTFQNYEGKPLNDTYNGVTSLKFLYEIESGKVMYINSTRYLYHYEFATYVLGYYKGLNTFNNEQYTQNPQRKYILGSVSHYLSSDIFTMEFFGADELDCDQIVLVYSKIASTCFFGENLRFFSNTHQWESCTSIPNIKPDELFLGQDYQALNLGTAYGYLKKIDWKEVSSNYLSRHDIALMNGIPNDVPVVAGIITTEFQTPLSHINILSKNRKTPNMALRSGWGDDLINSLVGKLVRLDVTSGYYGIREVGIQEAENFWKLHEPSAPATLSLDTLTSDLVNLASSGINSVKTIGGKASNFAELLKISNVLVPEGSFAIPFYYYEQHLKTHGLISFIRQTLEYPAFKQDASVRELKLEQIRDTIKHCTIDPSLLNMVKQKLSESGFDAYRFRSSTNAEDVEGFNGAGLYDSFTGIPNDADKSIEKAIKKVWASLWNFRAFEEREYFKIDHFSVAMGILVHRSFPTEDANGVVITTNLYNNNIPAYTINSQFLEYSVVRPETNILPEQVLYYTISVPFKNRLEYINKSNLPDKPTELVLTEQEVIHLAEVCKSVEDHYNYQLYKNYPLDMEFKIDSSVTGSRKLYIKQVRPFKQ